MNVEHESVAGSVEPTQNESAVLGETSSADSALLDRLSLIREQPLNQRAEALNQLHQQLSQMVE
ncbi:MAG: hypothetical protein WBA28_04260 [Microbacteriaceae bacterium]